MKKWHKFLLLAVASLLVGFDASAQSNPIGALTGLSGEVTVVRANNKTTVKGKINLPVYEGDTIKVAKGGSATVWLLKGGLKTVKPDQPLLATDREPTSGKNRRVWNAFRQKSASSFRDENLSLVGATRAVIPPSQVVLLSPRNTKLRDDPMSFLFAWTKVVGADAYLITVGIFEGRGPEDRLWFSAVVENEFQWPANAPKFKAGKTYIWEVSAIKGDETISSETAWFSVLPKDKSQKLKADEEDIKSDENIDSKSIRHLLLAALYEDSELYSDAEKELKKIQDDPQQKNMVHIMLGDLYRKVGLDAFASAEVSMVDPSLIERGWQ